MTLWQRVAQAKTRRDPSLFPVFVFAVFLGCVQAARHGALAIFVAGGVFGFLARYACKT